MKNIKANDVSLNNWPVDIPRPRQMASLWTDWTWHTGPLAGLGHFREMRGASMLLPARDTAILWVAYPKLSSKLASDLSRDAIREAAPSFGLDTVSQIAIDADWSALRLKRV